ncbi:MAG: RluA family pseudouridine synthase [Planctomycetota bacterium]
MSAHPNLDVLHVDNHVLVVAKRAGVPTVPDASGDESLLERAKAWIAVEYDKPGNVFLGVVQRLDRPVSGVLCFARTSKAADRLTRQLKQKRMTKRYLAVAGAWRAESEGTLEQWLVKDRQRNRVTVHASEVPEAKCAETRWRVLAKMSDRTLIELEPVTGRPHQLRVACATLGAPLLGDVKYGAPSPLPDKSVALHARTLELDHPTRDERLRFELDPPKGAPWRGFDAAR